MTFISRISTFNRCTNIHIDYSGSTKKLISISLAFLHFSPTHVHHSYQVPYEGRAKSSVTNRRPWFYPRYILKCFTALEWCVAIQLTIPVHFMQIAFQLTELFQIEIDAVIYTDQFICYIGTWTRRLKFVAILNAALGLI